MVSSFFYLFLTITRYQYCDSWRMFSRFLYLTYSPALLNVIFPKQEFCLSIFSFNRIKYRSVSWKYKIIRSLANKYTNFDKNSLFASNNENTHNFQKFKKFSFYLHSFIISSNNRYFSQVPITEYMLVPKHLPLCIKIQC